MVQVRNEEKTLQQPNRIGSCGSQQTWSQSSDGKDQECQQPVQGDDPGNSTGQKMLRASFANHRHDKAGDHKENADAKASDRASGPKEKSGMVKRYCQCAVGTQTLNVQQLN